MRKSSTVRMPPPTVSGMKRFSAVFATTSTIVARPSLDAVMSRKTEFVRALRVIRHGAFDRVARVAQIEKFGALHHASIGDVETGNDAFCQHEFTSRAARSGWRD